MKEDIKDPTFLSLTNLEKNTFQEWFDSWYGTADLEYGETTSTFAFYQDNKKYWGYQWDNSSKVILVSIHKFNAESKVEFIGCTWFGPNMRICKFPAPINSLENAKQSALAMLT